MQIRKFDLAKSQLSHGLHPALVHNTIYIICVCPIHKVILKKVRHIISSYFGTHMSELLGFCFCIRSVESQNGSLYGTIKK